MLSEKYAASETPGKAEEKDVMPEYKEKVLSFIDVSKIKPLKVVVDAGNGIGGKLFDYVFAELPIKVTKMYFEPDGNFPNHVPDPFKEENVAEIKKKTVELKADIGVAIDGDADRVFFIDNKGRRPSGAYTGAIMAKYFLKKFPGAKIIHCPRLRWVVEKEIKKAGGVPVMERVGHSFIKARMRSEDAVFSPETSAHFYYKDFYYADTSMVTIAIMLQLLSEGLDFDEQLDYLYETYPNSGEVNYVVDDTQKVLDRLENEFSDRGIDKFDGISVEFDNWRFNVRSSNTQPLLRLNVEGKDKNTVVEGFKRIEKIIGGKRDNIPELAELQ